MRCARRIRRHVARAGGPRHGIGERIGPHISRAAAEYQLRRAATARSLSPEVVRRLIAEHTTGRFLRVIGEPVVNVLELNLALDAATRGQVAR